MKIPLFRAIVNCNPPAKFGGRFRVGRHFPAGASEVLDLTQDEIDRLRSDVLAEDVSSIDRKTNKLTTRKIEKSFFIVSEIQPNGEKEVPDPKPAELPADRLPTGMEMFSLLMEMRSRMASLEEQNRALREQAPAPAPAAEPEPAKPSKAK